MQLDYYSIQIWTKRPGLAVAENVSEGEAGNGRVVDTRADAVGDSALAAQALSGTPSPAPSQRYTFIFPRSAMSHPR